MQNFFKNPSERTIKWAYLLVALLLALSLSSPAAHAQLQISDSEKPVFAFFRLAKQAPNYKRWISSSDVYMDASSKPELKAILQREDARLKWGFGTYDPAKDFLKIRTQGLVTLQEQEDGKNRLQLSFPGNFDPENPYFPYPYAEDWIAVIIKDLQRFKTLSLSAAHAQTIKNQLAGMHDLAVEVHMRIRPLSADIKAPMVINKQNYWGLSGDIAYIMLQTDAGERIFAYTAPWYLSDTETDLLNLLEQ